MPKLLSPTNVKIKDYSEGAERSCAARKMNLHLKKVFQSWCQGAQQLAKDELEVRYQWSQDLLRVWGDRDKYGPTAENLLFEAMGTQRPRDPSKIKPTTSGSPPAKQVESKLRKQRPRDPSKIKPTTSGSPPAKKKLKKISNKVRKKREPVLAA